MVRKLKYHEKKLLKKVDFINWTADVDNSIHENKIMRRYCVEKREHYTIYNKLSRQVGTFGLKAPNGLKYFFALEAFGVSRVFE